ncbi:DinB family protein [Intrasporangium mesophilum]
MNESTGASSTAELEALMATLRCFRTGVLDKLSGLSAEDARRSTVPSGTNLAGLIQHLTFVEAKFFEQIVAGGKPSRGARSMQVSPSVSLSTLRSDYRAACGLSDEIMRRLGDPAAPVSHDGKVRDLRWAILSVIGETAQHAGHADIIREQIDGKTGR